MILILLACTGPTPNDSSDDTAPADTGPQPAELAELTNGECPDFSEPGSSKFMSNDEERKVVVSFPAEPAEDMPLVFVWHGVGGTGAQMVEYLELDDYAEEMQAVVISPNALDSNLFGWDFWNGGDNDPALYDDLRTCAAQNFSINLKKVSSTGLSAGALWSSWLAIHRGDTLSTILPFSGGAEPIQAYSTPDAVFPALIAYGGESDTWGGGGFNVDFQETTINFANGLYGDGHEVVLCNHDTGHTIPRQGRDMMDVWLTAQTFGTANAVSLDDLPSYCMLYDGSLTTE